MNSDHLQKSIDELNKKLNSLNTERDKLNAEIKTTEGCINFLSSLMKRQQNIEYEWTDYFFSLQDDEKEKGALDQFLTRHAKLEQEKEKL